MKKLMILLTIVLYGCWLPPFPDDTRPPSANETSEARLQLRDRIRFVENYVLDNRNYIKLEYDILYYNNVPGPSDWNVRVLAEVPPSEIKSWIPANVSRSDGKPPDWVKKIPGNIPTNGLTEWYYAGRLEVGIDRNKSIIAYCHTSTDFASTGNN